MGKNIKMKTLHHTTIAQQLLVVHQKHDEFEP
jgi:hypothetical protein